MHTGFSQRNVLRAIFTIAFLIFIASCSGGGSSTPSSPRAWGIAELIQNGNADTPQIAMDSDGNAIAVWIQYDGNRTNIWANYFDGTSWGTAELIDNEDAGDADSPQIAMDGAGKATAVWRQFDGANFSIYTNRFDGTDWETDELIETSSGDTDLPQIAMDDDGNAMAVWIQNSGGNSNVWARYFDGTSWGTAELIETSSNDTDSPQIAMDNDGNAIAVWAQYDSPVYNIWARYFDGTSWNIPKLVDSNNNGSAYYPQIAMDGDGNAAVVWQQFDGFRNNIWANYFTIDTSEDTGKWGTAELIEHDRGNASPPQVAMDGDGNAMAVWTQSDGTQTSIYANRFDGSAWDSPELIETGDAGDAELPQIAMDDDGNAIAVWTQSDGAQFSIYTNRFDGSAWDSPELIETSDTGDADAPQITMDGDGNAMAVWVQYNGGQYNMYVNRFE